MTPTTIVLACLATFFFGAWLSARRTVASRENSIVARDETIADLERRNFEAGARIDRLESQLATANQELAGFKAGVKAAVADRAVETAVKDPIEKGVVAKPLAKRKPAAKAPAKKAPRK